MKTVVRTGRGETRTIEGERLSISTGEDGAVKIFRAVKRPSTLPPSMVSTAKDTDEYYETLVAIFWRPDSVVLVEEVLKAKDLEDPAE